MSHYLEESNCDYTGLAGRRCLRIILAVLGALFTFVVGVIIGAFIAGVVFLALPALIVLAIVLLILIAIAVFTLVCRRCRRNCD